MTAKNPDFPSGAYGRWAELISASRVGSSKEASPLATNFATDQQSTSANAQPPLVAQCPSTATAQWLLTSQPPTDQSAPARTTTDQNTTTRLITTVQVPSETSVEIPAALNLTLVSTSTPTPTTSVTNTAAQQEKLPPTQADFSVPTNQIEHKLMVQRLVDGGSLVAEAEQTNKQFYVFEKTNK